MKDQIYEKLLIVSQISNPTREDVGLPMVNANNTTVQNVLSLAFGVIGALTVLVIIIAALRMVISDGDPEKIANSRKAIIYALVGLVIAVLAQAIVFFVLGEAG